MSTYREGHVIEMKGHTIKVKATGYNPPDGWHPIRVELHPHRSTAVEVFEGPNAMSSAEDAAAGLNGEWRGKQKTMPWTK